MLRYRQWRAVIAEYAADRLGLVPEDLVPATIAQVSLALALTAYERWLADDSAALGELVDGAMRALAEYLLE